MKTETKSKDRNFVFVLLGLTLLATMTSLVLWALDYKVAGTVVGVTTFFLWLVVLVVTVAVVVSWWSATLMQRGAELALRSQESDDRRDIALIRGVSDLTKVLLRQNQPSQLALPLPGQGDWLPKLSEGEFEEVSHD